MIAADAEKGRRYVANDNGKLTFKVVRNLLTIFVILVFLGFPGTLKNVIGSGPAKLLETASFGLQFLLIALASGEDVMSIKLLNINYAYTLIYLFLFYIVADSMLVSIDRKMVLTSVIHLVLTAMFALWLIDQFNMEELLELFYYALVVFVGIMLIGTVIFQKVVFYSYHGSRTFRGLFSTKNECGTMLSLGIILQVVLLISRRKNKKRISLVFLVILGAQFILLVLTKNMGSLLVSFVAIGYIIYFSMQKKKKRLPLCMIFIVASVGFLFFALTILQALGPFLESMGKDATLTGRVPLWEQAIGLMQENKTLTGYGYLMFWRTPSIVKVFHSRFPANTWAATFSASMHNMLIEFWCDTGLIGIGLMFLMLVFADRGVKHMGEEQYMFSSAFIIMYTVSNLTERGMGADSLFTMVFFLVLGLMYQAFTNAKYKRLKKARIYDAETGKRFEVRRTEGEAPDIFAFQKKFSNQAFDSQPGRLTSAGRGKQTSFQTEEEEEEDKTDLDALFQSLYDDDDK